MTKGKRPLIPLLTGMGLMLIASAAGSFGLFGAGFVLVVWAIAWHLKICNQQQHKAALHSYKREPRNAQSSGAKPYASKRTQPDKRKTYPSRPSQAPAENKPPQWYFPPDKPVEPQPLDEIPEPIIRQVMKRNVDRGTAIRLLEWTAERNPGRDWGWVGEKVVLDLERDRSRM